MSQQLMHLNLPSDLYDRIRRVAEDSERPVEEMVIETLSLLFDQEAIPADLTLDDLESYTDAQLWALVYHRMAWPQDTRLRELIALGKRASLTDDEQHEVDSLLEQLDQLILMRSRALLVLKQRGVDVERHIKRSA